MSSQGGAQSDDSGGTDTAQLDEGSHEETTTTTTTTTATTKTPAAAEVEYNNVIEPPVKPVHSTTTMHAHFPAEIAFHSPSAHIIGTPFSTTDSSRFEYPFPDVSSLPSLSPSEGHHSPSPPFGASFTSSPGSGSLHHYPTSPMLRPISPRTSFQLPSSVPKQSSMHPKMSVSPTAAPVPPGLAKKLQRWSMGLLRRRGSSVSSQVSTGSKTEGASPTSPAAPMALPEDDTLRLEN